MNRIIDHLNDVLENDETEYGGVSYYGETLGEFLEELNANKSEFISMYDDISVINKQLKDCGIKEIEVKDIQSLCDSKYDDIIKCLNYILSICDLENNFINKQLDNGKLLQYELDYALEELIETILDKGDK